MPLTFMALLLTMKREKRKEKNSINLEKITPDPIKLKLPLILPMFYSSAYQNGYTQVRTRTLS